MKSIDLLDSPSAMLRYRHGILPRKRVGFVPTMGCLHEGHMSLIKQARKDCDLVVVSIFVNPLQFGKNEDFSRYPRTFERDLALCEANQVDAIFSPSVNDLFKKLPETSVNGGPLTKMYCGKTRPGHFDGVLTIVSILFQLVKPHMAYFGEKDFQQLFLIQNMVRDLFFDVQIVPMPIIREKDGLAMSSRNIYLDEKDRLSALGIYRTIQATKLMASDGNCSSHQLREAANRSLDATPGVRKDYVALVDSKTLLPLGEELRRSARLLTACYVGNTRLIDNDAIF